MLPPTINRIEVITGDITTLRVAAIVNAANESLLGGGGVDGAIHRAAGPQLLEVCRTLGGCPTGQAKATPGFNLPAGHVIHTVGPVWHGDQSAPIGDCREDALLASCYDCCLNLAAQHQFETVAFPAISTGVYGFPKARAATIAVGRVTQWLDDHDFPLKVTFCCFSQADASIYQNIIAHYRHL